MQQEEKALKAHKPPVSGSGEGALSEGARRLRYAEQAVWLSRWNGRGRADVMVARRWRRCRHMDNGSCARGTRACAMALHVASACRGARLLSERSPRREWSAVLYLSGRRTSSKPSQRSRKEAGSGRRAMVFGGTQVGAAVQTVIRGAKGGGRKRKDARRREPPRAVW